MISLRQQVEMAIQHERAKDFVSAEQIWVSILQFVGSGDETYFRIVEHQAFAMHMRGRTEAAIGLLGNLLEAMIGQLGLNHMRCALLMNRMAGLHFYQGDLSRAEELCRSALSICDASGVTCDAQVREAIGQNLSLVDSTLPALKEVDEPSPEPAEFDATPLPAANAPADIPPGRLATALQPAASALVPRRSLTTAENGWKKFCDMSDLIARSSA
jgi:hypothetical protein